jgi:hypothetical protein
MQKTSEIGQVGEWNGEKKCKEIWRNRQEWNGEKKGCSFCFKHQFSLDDSLAADVLQERIFPTVGEWNPEKYHKRDEVGRRSGGFITTK